MKKIILTTEQFMNICEDVTSNNAQMNFMANDETDIPELGETAFKQITDNGGKNVQINIRTNSDNISSKPSISGNGSSPSEQLTNAIENTKNSNMSVDDVNLTMNIDGSGSLINNEGKCYTKKSLEEKRLDNIRNSGKIYTKKQLTEAFLHDLSAQQVKNITGIQDDDELNISIEAEDRENILSNICKDIAMLDNAKNIYSGVFKFIDIIKIMKNYGFKYVGPNEDEETYVFRNNENEIIIWPYWFYPNPGAIHIDNININSTSLNESKLYEASKSYEKRKYINKLYTLLSDETNRMYKDDDWGAVSMIYRKIKNFISNNGEIEMRVENGGYWKQIGEFPNYKEYLITITLNNGIIINGSLKCHAAGTIEDTFKYYDITCTFY